jgi:hypothetical protein
MRATSRLANLLEMFGNLLVMRVRIGHGGWVGIDDLGLPGLLYLRLGGTDDSGRLRITELYLDASTNRSTAILDTDLRNLPLSAIETVINTELADDVLKRINLAAPDLATLASYYDTSFGNYQRQVEDRNWVVISFASQFSQEERDHAGLPKVAHVPRKDRKRRTRDVDSEYRLTERPDNGLTDDFLQQVARAYTAAMLRGERPNLAISQQLGYPLKTVQRWVYTARQRGIMPRGSKGKAG